MEQLFSDADLRLILVLVWLYFPFSLVMAFVAGVIPAHGSKGGSMGFGHLCWREDDPATFKQAVTLNIFVTIAGPVVFVLSGIGGA